MSERFKVKLGRFYDNGQILTEDEVLKLLNEIQRWENIVVEDTEHIEKLQNENEQLKKENQELKLIIQQDEFAKKEEIK